MSFYPNTSSARLRKWNGRSFGPANHVRWLPQPNCGAWLTVMKPIRPSPDLIDAVAAHEWQWTFELPDEGGASVCVSGSATDNIVLYLGASLSDAAALYVVFGSSGCRVYRTRFGKTFYSPRLTVPAPDVDIYAARPCFIGNNGGCFSFTYDNGHFELFDSAMPNPENLCFSFSVHEANLASGVSIYSFGVVGKPRPLWAEFADDDVLRIEKVTPLVRRTH